MFSKKNIGIVLTTFGVAFALTWSLPAQDKAGDKKEKQWKSQAEYDIFAAAQKDANAQNRLGELDKWKQQFPESEYNDVRDQMYLITYQQLNQPRQAFDKSVEILKTKPDYARALTAILYYVQQIKPPQPADIDTAEKTANYVIDNLDKIYAPANKEEGTSDADWAKQKADMKPYAYQTLVWIATQRKDTGRTISDLTKILQKDPTQAAASYNLAGSILADAQATKKLDEQPLALFHYARAASYDGPNSLPAATRQQVQASLTKMYTTYHGSNDGLPQLMAAAKTTQHSRRAGAADPARGGTPTPRAARGCRRRVRPRASYGRPAPLPRGRELRLERGEPDEALGGRVREGLALGVRRERVGVQRVLGAPAADHRRARPELDPDLAAHELLRRVDERVQGVPERAEPQALVDEVRPGRLELALRPQLGLRQHEILEGAVRLDEDERRRGLVELPALDPDHPVLDHVDSADPVPAGAAVQLVDELVQRQLVAVERDRKAFLERDHHVRRRRSVGGVRGSRKASAGGAVHGSSSTPASIERPNRSRRSSTASFRVASTGIRRASA